METVLFKAVMRRVCALCGLRWESLLREDAARLGEMVSRRVRFGWEFYPWPELVRTEERLWDEDFLGIVGWAQDDEEPIGTPLAAHWEDPRKEPRARELRFVPMSLGVQVQEEQVAESVWLVFVPRAPMFDAEEWDAQTEYQAGEVRYVAAAGDCFRALETTTGDAPAESPDSWERVRFPRLLMDYVCAAAAADWYAADGQHEKALAEEARAEGWLIAQVTRFVSQTGSQGRGWRYGPPAGASVS